MNINEISVDDLYDVANWDLQWWNDSSGHFNLVIKYEDAQTGHHSGDCSEDVEALAKFPYIKKQLETLDEKQLVAVLREYGGWDMEELSDHDANLNRVLWIACDDIVENYHSED